MFCPKCGTENQDDAKFCGSCGSSINIVRDQPAAGFNTLAVQPAAVSVGLKIGIIIATLFIPLIGIVMGGIYMYNQDPSKKAVGKLWLIVGAAAFVFHLILYSADSY